MQADVFVGQVPYLSRTLRWVQMEDESSLDPALAKLIDEPLVTMSYVLWWLAYCILRFVSAVVISQSPCWQPKDPVAEFHDLLSVKGLVVVQAFLALVVGYLIKLVVGFAFQHVITLIGVWIVCILFSDHLTQVLVGVGMPLRVPRDA